MYGLPGCLRGEAHPRSPPVAVGEGEKGTPPPAPGDFCGLQLYIHKIYYFPNHEATKLQELIAISRHIAHLFVPPRGLPDDDDTKTFKMLIAV